MNATHQDYSTMTPAVLYMAMELGEKEWKLGFTVGQAQPARLRTIPARDRRGLPEEIGRAKAHFDLPEDAPVRSCYEAGRDGFWVHRFLESIGVDNRVIDSSSIEVPRRSRRAKTDRLDAASLLKLLIRDHQGEPRVWSVVRVPSEDQEDARQLHRELEELKHEQTAHSNRIKGLLATCGVTVTIDKRFPTRVKNLRLWNGQGIPADLLGRLLREFSRMQQVNAQIRQLEHERAKRILQDAPQEPQEPNQPTKDQRKPKAAQETEPPKDKGLPMIRQLMRLRGIGVNGGWMLVRETFGWRKFKNRREVAGCSGLTPTPYASGEESHDQGISKAGNRRLRTMLIELAWGWVRFQPECPLTQWFRRRFAGGSKRQRRIGIVALARKLLVALWKYLETGVPPEGAVLGDWEDKVSKYTVSLG